jgi:hypothetical protein
MAVALEAEAVKPRLDSFLEIGAAAAMALDT